MESHPIESLMKTTMESIKQMIDADTIVGNPVASPDGSLILPISRVSFGFTAGGSEFISKHSNDLKQSYPFGGGAGAGVTLKPVAFLVIKNDSVRLLSVEHSNNYDLILDTMPQILETIKKLLKKDGGKEPKDDTYSKED